MIEGRNIPAADSMTSIALGTGLDVSSMLANGPNTIVAG
jgi:predicted DsbA family dithiol-disulfide isomerase